MLHTVKSLKSHHYVVINKMGFCEGTLILNNDLCNDSLQSISQDLRINLIQDITKIYRSKLGNKFRLIKFRDENNKSMIEMLRKGSNFFFFFKVQIK